MFLREDAVGPVAVPDTLVGTDSHTTMINGLGVVGWGVGGIEAEAVMLGQPIYMLMPEVVGFELTGALAAGATATDLVLTVTEMLRSEGVVGKFVEFFGDGVSTMSLADRATIANMAPEYGATMGFFPVDDETLVICAAPGAPSEKCDLVERYTKEQELFRTDDGAGARLHQDTRAWILAPSSRRLAGPNGRRTACRCRDEAVVSTKRCEPRSANAALPCRRRQLQTHGRPSGQRSTAADRPRRGRDRGDHQLHQHQQSLGDAGRRPAGQESGRKGLTVPAVREDQPGAGSRVVTDYLDKAGLTEPLEATRFPHGRLRLHDLHRQQRPAARAGGRRRSPKATWWPSAVLSGNRNFEGRVNPLVKANYLASPPLVVAYALAGTTDIDLTTEPLGQDRRRATTCISRDIWPTHEEIEQAIADVGVAGDVRQRSTANAFDSNEMWNAIQVDRRRSVRLGCGQHLHPGAAVPGRSDAGRRVRLQPIAGARVLALLGDSVTTDHISPAGAIAQGQPGGPYLSSTASSRETSTATARGAATTA